MNSLHTMFAESITESASKQTYYTIRLLVDRERATGAFCAYAYFRWVDDTFDEGSASAAKRLPFLERQRSPLVSCFEGNFPRNATVQENLLMERVRKDQNRSSWLHFLDPISVSFVMKTKDQESGSWQLSAYDPILKRSRP